MGSMCSSCSDGGDSDAKNRKGDSLLPEKQQETSSREGIPTQSAGESLDLSQFDSLYEDLARFLRTLPGKSKKHIWEHSVRIKNEATQKKTVMDKTKDKEQIAKLLCDCVIVYIKYLDRKRPPLSTRTVSPHVAPAAEWIQNKFGSLEKNLFESDKEYLAQMLEEYQHELRFR